MKTLKWHDEYSVGVKELDDQHRSLLEIINALIEKQDSRNTQTFAEDIATLIHYAYTHFATEERYLIDKNFPDLKQHILEHVDFIMKTLTLCLEADKDETRNRQDILGYLKKWYSSHVLGIDRKYIPYLRKGAQVK